MKEWLQEQRLDAAFFGKLFGTAPAQKANYAAKCGKFLENVRPLCGDFVCSKFTTSDQILCNNCPISIIKTVHLFDERDNAE